MADETRRRDGKALGRIGIAAILILSVFSLTWCVSPTMSEKADESSPSDEASSARFETTPSMAQSRAGVSGARNLLLRADFESESISKFANKPFDKLNVRLPSGQATYVGIQYEAGGRADNYARIIDDPTQPGNHVLHFRLTNGKGSKGRIQINLPVRGRDEVYQRVRMYLHPNLEWYEAYPAENGWFTINEFWLGPKWEGHPYPFRISLGIAKGEGKGSPLAFVASGQVYRKPGKGDGDIWGTVWGEVGRNFRVPVGEWVTLEVGYKAGDKDSGRFYVAARKDSEESMTEIFDVRDWTYHPDSPEPVLLTQWNPVKIYTSVRLIDFIRKNGAAAQIYWDDLEIYASWPDRLVDGK